MDWILTGSLIIHVLCAALLVGGAFFFRVIVMKYAALTPGGMSDELRATLVKRWLHLAMMLLLTLVITGFYQMAEVGADWKAGKHPGTSPGMVFGIKFLVAMVIFALLLGANVVRSTAIRGHLLTVNLLLGMIVIVLSVVLSNSYVRGKAGGETPQIQIDEKSGDFSSGS